MQFPKVTTLTITLFSNTYSATATLSAGDGTTTTKLSIVVSKIVNLVLN